MKKAVLYGSFVMLASIFFNYFSGEKDWGVNAYYGVAFGLAWGLAYYLDRPDFFLAKKLILSLLGMIVLLIAGLMFFNTMIAVPSLIRFSAVFVAYYLLASFRSSKSFKK